MENDEIEIVTWTEIPEGLSADSVQDCMPADEQLGDPEVLSGNLVPGDLQLEAEDFSLPEPLGQDDDQDEEPLAGDFTHADVLHAAGDLQGSSLNVDEMTSAMASQFSAEEPLSDEVQYDFSDVDSGDICEFDELVGDAPQGQAESLSQPDTQGSRQLADVLGGSSSLAINEELED